MATRPRLASQHDSTTLLPRSDAHGSGSSNSSMHSRTGSSSALRPSSDINSIASKSRAVMHTLRTKTHSPKTHEPPPNHQHRVHVTSDIDTSSRRPTHHTAGQRAMAYARNRTAPLPPAAVERSLDALLQDMEQHRTTTTRHGGASASSFSDARSSRSLSQEALAARPLRPLWPHAWHARRPERSSSSSSSVRETGHAQSTAPHDPSYRTHIMKKDSACHTEGNDNDDDDSCASLRRTHTNNAVGTHMPTASHAPMPVTEMCLTHTRPPAREQRGQTASTPISLSPPTQQQPPPPQQQPSSSSTFARPSHTTQTSEQTVHTQNNDETQTGMRTSSHTIPHANSTTCTATGAAPHVLDERITCSDAEESSQRTCREWVAELQEAQRQALREQKRLFARALTRARAAPTVSSTSSSPKDTAPNVQQYTEKQQKMQMQIAMLQSQVSELQSQLAEAVEALASERAEQESRLAGRLAEMRAVWESSWRERIAHNRHVYTTALTALTQEMHTALAHLRQQGAEQRGDLTAALEQSRAQVQEVLEQRYRDRLQAAEHDAHVQAELLTTLRARQEELAEALQQSMQWRAKSITSECPIDGSNNNNKCGNTHKEEDSDARTHIFSAPPYAIMWELMCEHQRQRESLWLRARAADWAMYREMQRQRDALTHDVVMQEEREQGHLAALRTAQVDEMRRALTAQSVRLQSDWAHLHRRVTAESEQRLRQAWRQVQEEVEHAATATRAEQTAACEGVRERALVAHYEAELTRLREWHARERAEQHARWQCERETLLREAEETYEVQLRELRQAAVASLTADR